MPGIGGSLGMCALCGDGFITEILLGKSVRTVGIDGMDKDVCLHDKCLKVLEANGPDWHTLPDGPLRKAYERALQQPPSDHAVAAPTDEPPSAQFAKKDPSHAS